MSSWRESDREPSKPIKPVKPAKPSKPLKPVRQNPSIQPVNAPKTDWRGKSKGRKAGASVRGAAGSGRDWLTPNAPETGFSRSFIRKWAIVGFLFTAFVATTGILIQQLFFRLPKLPLYAISVGNYPNIPEFRENPFGNQQRSHVESINGNYVRPYSRVLHDNDNFLGLLRSKEWRNDVQLPADLVDLGRKSTATAYYINCFARIDQDQVLLYHQSSSPFTHSDSEAEQTVDLQSILESLASAAPSSKGRYVWVILDLQVPQVVSNLGDLSPPWRTAVENTLARVKNENPEHPELYDRLIVTLPADDGQNNWLAPEYSSSFFGYHLFRLLDTPQENASLLSRLLGKTIKLDEFQSALNLAVTNDVANRRYAVQQPVWLPKENLDRYNNLGLVGGSRGSFRTESVGDPRPRLREVLELWKKLNESEYRDAYRWDPVGHAKVESQLLALEESALILSDENFKLARQNAEDALSGIIRPVVQYSASLIEDAIRADYFCTAEYAERLTGKTRLGLLVNRNESPILWEPAAGPDQESPVEQLKLNPAEKLRLVWETYLMIAKSSQGRWDEAFQADRLDRALRYLELNYQSDRPPPIEIYLLQRLRDDLDWQRPAPGRTRACASALTTFDRLQRLAVHPEPELSRWLPELIKNAEADFLVGFDFLLAGDFENANERLSKSTAQLQLLEQSVLELAAEMESAQKLIWVAPHALAWLLKEFQFTVDPDKTLQDLTALGQAVRDSMLLYRQAAGSQQMPQPSVDSQRLQVQLAGVLQKFTEYIESKTVLPSTSAASGTPQTFRRNRIALACPLLTTVQRQRLHDTIAAFLASPEASASGAAELSLKEQRLLDNAFNAFLDPIDSATGDQSLWKSRVSGDVRYNLLAQLKDLEPAAPTALGDRSQLCQNLLEAELRVRVLANAVGAALSLNDQTNNQRSWPFSSACLRWKVAETQRCVWQVERLAEAGWGSGTVSPQPDPQRFYFGRMANLYAAQLPNIPASHVSGSVDELVQDAQRVLQMRAQGLVGLRVDFGAERQSIGESDEVRAPIYVKGVHWNAVAAVYLGKRGQPLPWNIARQEDRVWPVQLNSPDEGQEMHKAFSTQYWKSGGDRPLGTLSIRGNYRSEPIDWRSESAPFVAVELRKESRSDAEIFVDSAGDAPIMNVVILLDCSNSMNLMVDALVEQELGNAPVPKVELFKQVSEHVKQVLRELALAHEHREADIRVCMIPFGIDYHSKLRSEFLKKMLTVQRVSTGPKPPSPSGEVGWGHFYATSNFVPLNEQGRSQLEELVDELARERKVDTPLYDAIREACGQIKRNQGDSNLSVSQILAFSDGVHNVNDGSPYKSTSRMVQTEVEALQCRLNIFFYNNFQTWINADSKRQENRSHWEQIEQQGVKELEDLRQNSKLIDFVNSSDAAELIRRALETIPRTQVEVTKLDSARQNKIPVRATRAGFSALVPAASLPGQFKINSSGTRGGAEQQVGLLGGERVNLQLDGRNYRQFRFPPFDPDSNPTGWFFSGQGQRLGGGFSGNLWFRQDVYHKDLTFEWIVRDQAHPQKFTERPRFVVGMIAGNQPGSKPFLLADYYFKINTHYPELRFAPVPWKEPSAQLTLWIADQQPSGLEWVPVEPESDGKKELGKAEVVWKRSGSGLVVDVHYSSPPRLDDLVVVICPSAPSASRRYYIESNDEKYEFSWEDSPPDSPIELQMTTVAQLMSWVNQGQITQIINEGVRTVD